LYSFSRFGFIVRTDKQTDTQTDADERFIPAILVGTVGTSNNSIAILNYQSDWSHQIQFSGQQFSFQGRI